MEWTSCYATWEFVRYFVSHSSFVFSPATTLLARTLPKPRSLLMTWRLSSTLDVSSQVLFVFCCALVSKRLYVEPQLFSDVFILK